MILLTVENGFLSSLTEGNIVVIVIVVIAVIAGFLLLGRLLHVLVHLSYIMSQASSLFSAAKTASENEHGNQQYGRDPPAPPADPEGFPGLLLEGIPEADRELHCFCPPGL